MEKEVKEEPQKSCKPLHSVLLKSTEGIKLVIFYIFLIVKKSYRRPTVNVSLQVFPV